MTSLINIRPFRNSDLPFLFEIWMGHWTAARQTPASSITAIERAIVSRMSFQPDSLLVATSDQTPVAWCHHRIDDESATERTATIAAICFAGEAGLNACDELLCKTESRLRELGVSSVTVGPVRDVKMGYAGLSPIGHGIGVPVADARTASLLSRHGYNVARSIQRWVVPTSTYRPSVNREFLNLRRRTRIDRWSLLPTDPKTAVALSHFDIERHILFDHTTRTITASVDLWLSDVEMHVMDGSRGILSLDLIHPVVFLGNLDPAQTARDTAIDHQIPQHRSLTVDEQFLVTSVIPTLATRNIYSIEIAIDDTSVALIEQFKTLKFTPADQGRQWCKSFSS